MLYSNGSTYNAPTLSVGLPLPLFGAAAAKKFPPIAHSEFEPRPKHKIAQIRTYAKSIYLFTWTFLEGHRLRKSIFLPFPFLDLLSPHQHTINNSNKRTPKEKFDIFPLMNLCRSL